MEWLVRLAARRPALTLGIIVALAILGGLLALGMQPSTGTGTFVSSSSASYQATQDDQRHFGGDPVIVLIREPLTDLVLTKELATVTKLEACLAGETVSASSKLGAFVVDPPGAQAPYGGWKSPCGQLMRQKPVQVVYGPGTFLNRSVAAVNTEVTTIEAQAANQIKVAERSAYLLALGNKETVKQAVSAALAAGRLEQQQQEDNMAQMYVQSGIQGLPQIDDQDFISQIVFDQTRGVNQPKARFSYLFPTANAALIQVRLKASLSPTQQQRAITLVRQVVKMPQFASTYGGTYTVSGAPVVLGDLSSQLTRSIAWLLAAALVVMAVVLWVAFRSRPRLLPLAIALSAAGITFGLSAAVGASLTMASLAVLPVLIGLAVDYAVQFQSRVDEGRRQLHLGGREALIRAAVTGAPTIAVAALATATGFLVLLLSPVPMVRGFAVLLVLGIAVALLCALTGGSAALVLADRRRGRPQAKDAGGTRRGAMAAAVRGAGELLTDAAGSMRGGLGAAAAPPRRAVRALARTGRQRAHPARRRRWPARLRPAPAAPGSAGAAGRRWSERLFAGALASPWRILAIGAALAVLGWVADTQTAVQSDITKLVPSNMPALRDLRQVERITGVSGEIDVVVRGHNVATPQTIGWMINYEQKLFSHFGYVEAQGCAHSLVCPGLSLPDLFSAGSSGASSSPAGALTAASVQSLLSAVPSYFRQAVITSDDREAMLAFGIRLMPLSRQQQVIDYMNAQLHPPPGVSAALAGLPVLAAEANSSLSSSPRRLLTLLAGLIAVGLALAVVLRRAERVVVPLVPIALATGWSALILFALRIPLNPMSATLGALVIAISTEFSVLLSERYRQERRAGRPAPDALRFTYRSTGAAVLVSGLTAIAGFGVLVLSNITMLRDFGFVTVIDLTVSLLGVLLVLPAVLALSEREGLRDEVRSAVASLARGLPRPRRRTRVA